MLHHGEDRDRALKGGLIGGLVGGTALSIVLIAMAMMNGQDVWQMSKGAAAPFLHERAMLPGFDALAVLAGVASHYAVSIVCGVLFGLLAFGLTKSGTLLLGALWGLVVWVGMHYLVLPILGLGALASASPISHAVALHVLFGITAALGFLPFQQTRVPRRAELVT